VTGECIRLVSELPEDMRRLMDIYGEDGEKTG